MESLHLVLILGLLALIGIAPIARKRIKKAYRDLRNYRALARSADQAKADLEAAHSQLKEFRQEIETAESSRHALQEDNARLEEESQEAKSKLDSLTRQLEEARQEFATLDDQAKDLQALRSQEQDLKQSVEQSSKQLEELSKAIGEKKHESAELEEWRAELMRKVDLYSRVDELVDFGFYEPPEYLFETSARFAEEIKRVRAKQKEMIKERQAVTYPESIPAMPQSSQAKTILKGQAKLMLTAFNIECDLLIEKVTPGNYARTMARIEKLAETLEKSAATMHMGFDLEYVKLKYEECTLQYQFKLKKQEEKEEQRLIREQMREEQKAVQEYERAIADAEKEERIYSRLLEKARKTFETATAGERVEAEQKIAILEEQLAEARAKSERARSMAEQTKRGHVYVISNVGSFGTDVYKIGLTRRLDQLPKVLTA